MADLDAIRRGLAANLRDALPAGDGHVGAYMLDSPTPPALQVVGLDEIDYDTLGYGGAGDTHLLIVEAVLGRFSDIGSQKTLDNLLSGADSVKAALESDKLLTSRLEDDGTVTTGQPAAAEWLKVRRYRGQTRFALPNGNEVLLASWLVEVAA